MKSTALKFILLVFLFLAACTVTPYVPVEFANVLDVPNQDQKSIYSKSRQWFSEYFVSGKSVVDYEDKETGTIIGNGVAKIGSDPFGIIAYGIKFTLRVDTKDGKFKVTSKINEHNNTDSTNVTYIVGAVSKQREDDAKNHVNKLVSDLNNYITSQNKKSDW